MGAAKEPISTMARSHEHVHATFVRPLLDHAVTRMGRSRTEAVLRRLGTTEACLRDPEQWMSLGLTEQLLDAFIEESDDPHFVEEAFALVRTGRVMWLIRPLLQWFGSPRAAYEQMAAAIPRVNRAGSLQIESLSDQHVVLDYASDLETHVQLCRGRVRQFVQVPSLFGATKVELDHPQCLHRGDPRCRYEIRWTPAVPWWRRWFRGWGRR